MLAESPRLLTAVALIECVPWLIFLPCQVAEQEVVLGHVARGALSALMVMDEMPLGWLAEAAMLTAPLAL